jgi:hypothetical protein
MVSQQNRKGEGFNDGTPLTSSSHVADTELPSPAAEVGFIRFRRIPKVPELGQARVRVAEGAITSTAPATLISSQALKRASGSPFRPLKKRRWVPDHAR